MHSDSHVGDVKLPFFIAVDLPLDELSSCDQFHCIFHDCSVPSCCKFYKTLQKFLNMPYYEM